MKKTITDDITDDISDDISDDIKDDITNDLISEMPDVQENAIAQLSAEKEKSRSKLRDRIGRAFDAVVHVTDEEGEPLLTKRGELRIRRGKGPKAQKSKVSYIGGLDGQADLFSAKGDLTEAAQIQVTGQTCASLTFVIGMALFGDDGKPTKDEINQITGAYQTYLTAKGYKDLPPGVVLLTAITFYALPRFMKPKQKKRIATLWDKAKAKWSKKRIGTPTSNVESPSDIEV